MTGEELELLDKRVTAAKRLQANIGQAERHLETVRSLFSDNGELDAPGLRAVVRGLDVIRPGTCVRIAAAIETVVASVVGELRVDLEKV